jgi:putative peptidoglycan lipid II flippase
MSKQLVKSTSLVGSMTLISRILGFVRDMLVAQVFGASAGYDAFLVAFKLPNFFRGLLAEGAFAQAFVPLLAEYRDQKSHAETQHYLNAVAGSLALILFIFTVFAILFAPVFVKIFAPGFEAGGERFELATEMLRITFPYLFFIALVAFAGGILNTYGRFAVPAVTPTLLNIALILSVVLLASRMADPIKALAWGVLLGGVLQFLFQIPFLLRMGMLPKPSLGFKDPGVRKLLRLIVPLVYGASIVQINLVITTMFASFLVVGSVSWLYYAERLMQFPLGVFGVALATVVLPYLAKEHSRKDNKTYGQIFDWAIKTGLLIAIPAAVALYMLATPMLTTLFQYREFSEFDVLQSARALKMFSFGLLSFIMIKVLAAACYARQDMRGPVKIATISLFVSVAMNAILIQYMQHAGLALSTSISATVTMVLLYHRLHTLHGVRLQSDWGIYTARVLLSNVSMGLVLYYGVSWVGDWSVLSAGYRAGYLSIIIASGVASYGTILLLSGFRPRHVIKPIAL